MSSEPRETTTRGAEAGGMKVGRVYLPFSKAVRMAWQNLRLRPARTALTILSILAATGFVLFVLATTHLREAGEAAREVRMVATAEPEPAEAEDTGTGRLVWVVAVSLCACTVGIVNAMLMSITERYREIGTLKCLGALDAFVLKLFLLESVFQGMVGSLAGVVVGLGMALPVAALSYGGVALANAPWATIALDVLASVAIGMVLSVSGAVYPAMVAARMEPVDAMRARI
jgi:ABC-type antimicrobial peptide transport system permease subunit